MLPSTYLRTSSSLADISWVRQPLNFSSISGICREVAKSLKSVLGRRLSIWDSSADKYPRDVSHSSRASIIMKTCEYIAETDRRAATISPGDVRVPCFVSRS